MSCTCIQVDSIPPVVCRDVSAVRARLFCCLQASVLALRSLHLTMRRALAAKCFSDLQQHRGSHSVQLYIAEVTEDGTDSTQTVAGADWHWLGGLSGCAA
jgi:hypothetical protein